MKLCKKCNLAMEKGDRFCSKCGSTLVTIKKRTSKEKRKVIELPLETPLKETTEKKDDESYQKEKTHSLVNPLRGFIFSRSEFPELIIGFLLSVLFFLVIPLLWVFGYSIDLMRKTIKGEKCIPRWNSWKQLLDGFVFMGVAIVYFILPTVILGLGVSYRSSFIISEAVILFLASSFLFPISLTHYAVGINPFNFKLVFQAIITKPLQYTKIFIILIIIQVIVNVILKAVNFRHNVLNYFLWIVMVFLGIYLFFAWAKVYGLIYRSLGREEGV